MRLWFTHSVLQNDCYVIVNNVTSVFMKSRSFAAEWRVTAMLLYSDCQLLLIAMLLYRDCQSLFLAMLLYWPAMLLYSDLSTAPHWHCHVTVQWLSVALHCHVTVLASHVTVQWSVNCSSLPCYCTVICQLLLIAMLLYSDLSVAPHWHVTVQWTVLIAMLLYSDLSTTPHCHVTVQWSVSCSSLACYCTVICPHWHVTVQWSVNCSSLPYYCTVFCQLLLIDMLLYSDLSVAPHWHVTVQWSINCSSLPCYCTLHLSSFFLFLFLKHVSVFKCLEYYCFGMDFRKCCTSLGYHHVHKILHHYQILIMYCRSICGVFVVTCTIICIICFSYTNLVIIICCDWKEKLVFVFLFGLELCAFCRY